MNRLSFLKSLFIAPVAAKVLTEQVKSMPNIVKDPVVPAAPVSRLASPPYKQGYAVIACSGYMGLYSGTWTNTCMTGRAW